MCKYNAVVLGNLVTLFCLIVHHTDRQLTDSNISPLTLCFCFVVESVPNELLRHSRIRKQFLFWYALSGMVKEDLHIVNNEQGIMIRGTKESVAAPGSLKQRRRSINP